MGGMDMSALEGMMGQGGMPDLSALGGEQDARYEPNVWWRTQRVKSMEFAMKQSMKRMANKMKKKRRRNTSEDEGRAADFPF